MNRAWKLTRAAHILGSIAGFVSLIYLVAFLSLSIFYGSMYGSGEFFNPSALGDGLGWLLLIGALAMFAALPVSIFGWVSFTKRSLKLTYVCAYLYLVVIGIGSVFSVLQVFGSFLGILAFTLALSGAKAQSQTATTSKE
jgi:hypothetical protein